MKILAVDDERLALGGLLDSLNELNLDAEIVSFSWGLEARDYALENFVDIVFMDIDIGDANGMDVARDIKKKWPETKVIFTTGYNEYVSDALAVKASGYILKPVTSLKVAKELEKIMDTDTNLPTNDKVYIRTFGEFGIFLDGKEVTFSNECIKEAIAYMVLKHSDEYTSAEEAAHFIGGNEKADSKYIFSNFRKEVKKAGIFHIFEFSFCKVRINKDLVKCDYFDWVEGTAQGINAYSGSFMQQYNWARLEGV